MQSRITLESGPEALPRLLDEAERYCTGAGLDALEQGQVMLMLEELVVNAMTHGQAPPTSPVEVLFSFDGRDLHMEIRDQGRPFDPTVRRAPADDQPVDQMAIGGLGLFLTQQFADEMRYTRIAGVNQVHIRKRITGQANP